MEIIDIKGKQELGIKRFYLPVKINIICPNCESNVEINMEDDYLSYPAINTKEEIVGYCDNCDNNISIDIKLRIALEIDRSSSKITE